MVTEYLANLGQTTMCKKRLGLDIYGPLACGHVILSDNIVQSYGSNSITADCIS